MSYIVPMKKPICINCPFRNLDSCTLIYLMSDKDSEVTVHVNEMTVSPDCPLVEVKEPHGKLGDLDALQEQIKRTMQDAHMSALWKQGMAYAHGLVEVSKTVIEAEGSEE